MRYRITFDDGEQAIVTTGSINQALACAVRNDKWNREIVKVESQPTTAEERIETAIALNRQQGAK